MLISTFDHPTQDPRQRLGTRLAILAVLGLASAVGRAADEGPKIVAGPYLMFADRTSMAIMWETDTTCTAKVEFAPADSLPMVKAKAKESPVLLNRQAASPDRKTIHEITLAGLAPQTDYFYRVVSSDDKSREVRSALSTFQTAVREETPYAYIVLGDTRSFPDRFRKICDLAWAERPNFVLNVGDVVERGPIKQQWIDEFLAPAATLMARVPTFIAIGNHERNDPWYYKYVCYPKPENYYSFDFGNAHFTIVDSNEDLVEGSPQYNWVVKDLASTKAKWKFAAHHHPAYDSDSDDYGDAFRGPSLRGDVKVKSLIPVYEKYGVDVVWVGHIHSYERTWPIRDGKIDNEHGVIYVQAGGGGAPLEDFAPIRSWFTAKVLRNWQYCLVTIDDGNFRMMAYDIDGKMYDFLELRK